MPVSKLWRRAIITNFIETGWHHSPSGLTGQVVIDWCHANKRPYRVDVVPTVACAVTLLDHPSYIGSVPADIRLMFDLIRK